MDKDARIEQLPDFLSEEISWEIAERYGTPTYVYDEKTMVAQAEEAKSFPGPYGLAVRYAMKAQPANDILTIFDKEGVEIDASSGYEAERALATGIAGSRILLTSQMLPENLEELVEQGVLFNACSLHQLKTYGELFPDSPISVRINPGLGSGHSHKTNVGGPSSSFGIWHEQIPEVKSLAKTYRLEITRLHTHIGSGSDPEVWEKVAKMSLAKVEEFEDVSVLNLGGGFKVGRMSYEQSVDIKQAGEPIGEALEEFADRTGRKINLEIEPGTFLMANAGSIISKVTDIVNTGTEGYTFYKVDTGMTENLRPSLYGAQHPIAIVPKLKQHATSEPAVVVGRACESGDLLTPDPNDPEKLAPREMLTANIGDLAVIAGTGAYCESMAAHRYNSYPRAKSVLITCENEIKEIQQ